MFLYSQIRLLIYTMKTLLYENQIQPVDPEAIVEIAREAVLTTIPKLNKGGCVLGATFSNHTLFNPRFRCQRSP